MLARKLSIIQNQAAMFGYLNAVRAIAAAMLSPAYSKERFDWLYGTDTSMMSLTESQIPPEAMAEAVDYEPANVQTLHHVFRSLPFDIREYHLVDIGCGKGRTLLVGARYPFRRITGIELSPVTASIAHQNIVRYTAREWAKCKAIDVRCENGTNFTVPDGNLLCVLYNPFFGSTFQRCIEHLHAAKGDRELWLAYINPWLCEEYLMNTGYFERVKEVRVIPRTWKWNLWRHV